MNPAKGWTPVWHLAAELIAGGGLGSMDYNTDPRHRRSHQESQSDRHSLFSLVPPAALEHGKS